MILIVSYKVLCSIAIVLLSLLTAGHDYIASKHRSPWLCFLSALIGAGDGGGRCYFVMLSLSLLLHQPSLVAAVREMEGGNQGRICWAPLTRTLDWAGQRQAWEQSPSSTVDTSSLHSALRLTRRSVGGRLVTGTTGH